MVPKGWRPARSLDSPYPANARLLSEDQARRTARDRSPRPTYDAPRFESRVEQRRLLLISNLFGMLFQMDAQPSIRGKGCTEDMGFFVRQRSGKPCPIGPLALYVPITNVAGADDDKSLILLIVQCD